MRVRLAKKWWNCQDWKFNYLLLQSRARNKNLRINTHYQIIPIPSFWGMPRYFLSIKQGNKRKNGKWPESRATSMRRPQERRSQQSRNAKWAKGSSLPRPSEWRRSGSPPGTARRAPWRPCPSEKWPSKLYQTREELAADLRRDRLEWRRSE